MGSMFDTGASSRAKKQADLQRRQLADQKKKEDARSAEAKDEVERRKAIAAKGGTRGSLLTGAETGSRQTAAPTTAASMKPATSSKMGG